MNETNTQVTTTIPAQPIDYRKDTVEQALVKKAIIVNGQSISLNIVEKTGKRKLEDGSLGKYWAIANIVSFAQLVDIGLPEAKVTELETDALNKLFTYWSRDVMVPVNGKSTLKETASIDTFARAIAGYFNATRTRSSSKSIEQQEYDRLSELLDSQLKELKGYKTQAASMSKDNPARAEIVNKHNILLGKTRETTKLQQEALARLTAKFSVVDTEELS